MEELFNQYVVAYKNPKNNRWYRDKERHRTIKTARKRLEQLQTKYTECKIVWRKISYWQDYNGESEI